MMLREADLARMRDTIGETLVETATHLRRVRTSDGIGGFTESFTTDGTYPAFLVSGASLIRERAAELRDDATHLVILPHDADVDAGDRLQIGERVFQVVRGATEYTWAIEQRLEVTEL